MRASGTADLAVIDHIPVIDTALEVLRQATGLRVALVARVTDDSWTACAVLDDAAVGIRPGTQLELTKTY